MAKDEEVELTEPPAVAGGPVPGERPGTGRATMPEARLQKAKTAQPQNKRLPHPLPQVVLSFLPQQIHGMNPQRPLSRD